MTKKQQKVVHLSSVHSSNDNRIFHKQCRTLVDAGYDVVLVIPSDGDEIRDGVRIRSVPRLTSRLGRMLLTAWRVFRAGIAERGDIYHFHDPELIPFGLLLRLMGRKVIYDIHEDYVTSISQKRYLPRGLRKILAAVFGFFEQLAAKAFTLVLAERYYAQRFPSGHLVLNYPKLDYFQHNIDGSAKEQRADNTATSLQPQQTIKRLIYTGGVSIDRGALIYAKMLAEIPDIEITVIGKCSPDLAETMRKVAGAGASRLRIIGEGYFVPFEEISNLYRSESWTAGLAIFPETPHYVQKELTKFFEYMAAGIPVLCSNFPVWRELIEGNDVGLCVDPRDMQGIAEAIENLASDPQRAIGMGERAQEEVRQRFNWEVEGRKLVEIYERLLAS